MAATGKVMGFEPTYKELKQKRDVKGSMDEISFEPTYKELKLCLCN